MPATIFNLHTHIISVIIKVPLYLLISALSLQNFKGLLTIICNFALTKPSGQYAKYFQILHPTSKVICQFIKTTFGPISELKFNFTHVLICALILVILSLISSMDSVGDTMHNDLLETNKNSIEMKDILKHRHYNNGEEKQKK